jgi:hypothetical protein
MCFQVVLGQGSSCQLFQQLSWTEVTLMSQVTLTFPRIIWLVAG